MSHKTYVRNRLNTWFNRIVNPSQGVPPPPHDPMYLSPGQNLSIVAQPLQKTSLDQAGVVTSLTAQIKNKKTVQTIPVKQWDYIPEAPRARIVADSRLIMADDSYRLAIAQGSYQMLPQGAPSRLQSVPGYTTVQSYQNNNSNANYPAASKAPSPNLGRGCNAK
jgi:hypothetical protein